MSGEKSLESRIVQLGVGRDQATGAISFPIAYQHTWPARCTTRTSDTSPSSAAGTRGPARRTTRTSDTLS